MNELKMPKGISNGNANNLVRIVNANGIPWVPLSKEKAFRPLHFRAGDQGFVELLRFDPNAVMPLHRHSGETRVFVLEGALLLDTREKVETGGYIFEPTGTVDTWRADGKKPLVILVDVGGSVEYLNSDGSVWKRVTANTLREIYHAHCDKNGIIPRSITDH